MGRVNSDTPVSEHTRFTGRIWLDQCNEDVRAIGVPAQTRAAGH